MDFADGGPAECGNAGEQSVRAPWSVCTEAEGVGEPRWQDGGKEPKVLLSSKERLRDLL